MPYQIMKSLSRWLKKDEGDIQNFKERRVATVGTLRVGATLGYIPLHPTISAFFSLYH